ncbi:MAG: Nif3-like dinuclear metal center hexameric protein [Clostridiaceae bacterium]|nr:Nif3-like dinuclear metal center hexameric protein [Clostridiaceae bacterium]
MHVKCKDIMEALEEIAPPYFAEEWDNTGLIIGNRDKNIRSILVCLDVTSSTYEYAEKENIDMIISHHPLIFQPIKSIHVGDWKGRLISRIINKNICVYCAHTNLDYAEEGVNWHLARSIGLIEIKNLGEDCKAGKVGMLSPPQDLSGFIRNVKKSLRADSVKLIGSLNKSTEKVAVFAGSFDEKVLEFIASGTGNQCSIDVLVTGDIKYHAAVEMLEMGICAIDAGHFDTEHVIILPLVEKLKARFPGVDVKSCPGERGPFVYC